MTVGWIAVGWTVYAVLGLAQPDRPLYGRFLHITDIHPDPFYNVGAPVRDKCHFDPDETKKRRRQESQVSFGLNGKDEDDEEIADYYGVPDNNCDAPMSLVNVTFDFIKRELKDQIDFVVWTGDSARHDNDNRFPRTLKQIYSLNSQMTDQFIAIFKSTIDPRLPLAIPIVPNLGNNDIWPHNIMVHGPNPMTMYYSKLWNQFIPEYEKHTFDRGGYFISEVIPNRLSVVSLNTLFFSASNAAVDGCSKDTDPGYEQFEWLRIQLEILRFRGMKCWISGHVPPLLTKGEGKGWYNDCTRKYFYWMHAYRDVVIGHLFGHINIDHFDLLTADLVDFPQSPPQLLENDDDEGDLIAYGKEEKYIDGIREQIFSQIPKKRRKWGPWGEDFVVYNVAPSIIPKYHPAMRIIEYNITDLNITQPEATLITGKKKKKNGRRKRPKIQPKPPPDPPSSAPPGPAYSPQPLTPVRYFQYFFNLTTANAAYKANGTSVGSSSFEVEYTTDQAPFNMSDLTVPSFLTLARRFNTNDSLWQVFVQRALVGVR